MKIFNLKLKLFTFNFKLLTILLIITLFLALSDLVSLSPKQPDQNETATQDAVAEVEGQTITRADYQKEQELWQHFQAWAAAHHETITDDQDLLEKMIDDALISQYAKNNHIKVSEGELATRYQQAVASVGSEDEYLAKIRKIRNFDKDIILKKLQMEILAEKVEKARE